MMRIILPLIAAVFILVFTSTQSYAVENFEFRGNGFSLDSDLEAPTLYKSTMRMSFNSLSEVTKGSLIIQSDDLTLAVRMIPEEWNLSYNADGSFIASGSVYTLQDIQYTMKIQGERKFVANNWSMWQAVGELEGNNEKYSFQLVVTGDDRFATSSQNLTQRIIIPTGNAQQHERGSYIPESPTVFRGTVVTWMNHDTVTHTVQSQDGKGNVISLFNSGVLKPGDSFSHQFNEPGIYDYLCTLHPWRVGTITTV